MQESGKPLGYSSAQIALHWLVAALVIFQLLMGDQIAPAYRALRRGTEASAADLLNANIHIYVGIAVLVLSVVRLGFRLKRGAPTPPAHETTLQRVLASVTHWILYGVIIGMPVTGLMAWYLGLHDMGEIHEAAKLAIIVVVALHVLGAIWQHFVARTDVLVRMLKPEARAL